MGYFVTTDHKVKIYVEDLNPESKKTILFLHGWPGSTELFEYQFNQIPSLGYRCIGIDTRGFGKSDRPYHGYDYATLADDVKCVIDTLQLRDITLAGHSNGGAIAVKYMARHQGYGVSKLVLIAAGAPSVIKRPNFPIGADKEAIEHMIQATYNDRPAMLQSFFSNFFFQHTTEAFANWFLQIGFEAAGWSTAEMQKTWIKEVLFTEMEAIRVPTLIIQGVHDKVVPYQMAEVQHKLIKNSRLVPFKFSGHGSFYDQKDEFNQVLVKFIEGKEYC